MVPAILALEALGYKVTVAEDGVIASSNDGEFVADDPVAVLGLVKLVELRTWTWAASDLEIDNTLTAIVTTTDDLSEQVEPLELAVSWEPNAPEAILISNDLGVTSLAVRADVDDLDQRCVVFVWRGTRSASMTPPNDEALAGHCLYDKGLRGAPAGVVQNSALVSELERQNRVHPAHNARSLARLTHHVLSLKESVIEVVARTLTVERHHGSTMTAAAASLRN